MPRVIAYYTMGSQYEQLIEKLKASCEQFDVKINVRGYDDRGTWEQNCAIKSEFILDMLRSFPGETLIYIDADAVIKKDPELFRIFDADFGCHFLGGELLSGTLILNATNATIDLVSEWNRLQKEDTSKWDQKVLQEAFNDLRDSIDFHELPASYCKIFDNVLHKDVDPVIEHYQASRKVKRDRKIGTIKLPKSARSQPDGSIVLLHKRPADIKFMDKHFKRGRGLYRWVPDLETIEEADLDFSGKTGYIIGKGPSLDVLNPNDFPEDGPIIAINEALFKLEELYLPNELYMVQDPALREFAKPTKTTIILEQTICGLYRQYQDKLQYDREHMGLPRGVLSAIVAIKILQLWKIEKIVLIAFDACMNNNTEYAKVVGYKSSDKKRDPRRFLKHKKMLIQVLAGTSYDFQLAGKSD